MRYSPSVACSSQHKESFKLSVPRHCPRRTPTPSTAMSSRLCDSAHDGAERPAHISPSGSPNWSNILLDQFIDLGIASHSIIAVHGELRGAVATVLYAAEDQDILEFLGANATRAEWWPCLRNNRGFSEWTASAETTAWASRSRIGPAKNRRKHERCHPRLQRTRPPQRYRVESRR